MNGLIPQNIPRDDIIKTGQAFNKTGKLGTVSDCRLILRGYVAPFRLEVYSLDSNAGKVFSLENVKRVKFCSFLKHNFSLRIKFACSLCLCFNFLNEREAEEWTGQIQMHSLTVPRHLTLMNPTFQVNLLPNANCRFHGYYVLNVTCNAIRISNKRDTSVGIEWPVHTIRFYGYSGKMFSVATASCAETGEGVFLFDASSAKHGSKVIYDCVAALVSHSLQVAASAYWGSSSSSSFPPHSPTHHHLPDSIVPALNSKPSFILSNASTDADAGDDSSKDESTSTSPASNGISSDSPHDKNKRIILNSFYLKRIGMTAEKPTKAPEIYGLSDARRQILQVFSSTQDPLERFPYSAILYGPSNCGKCLLAREVAVHWGATLLCLPAQCLVTLERDKDAGIEMLFDVAMAQAPCIILIKNLESILASSLSAAEAECCSRVLEKVRDAFCKERKKMRRVGFIGTINDLSDVDQFLLSISWAKRQIYVPRPCLNTRRQVFSKALEDVLLDSPEADPCLSLLVQSSAGLDFTQIMDLFQDVRKVAVSDALDGESRNGRCEMRIRDFGKVREVVKENATERRRTYDESGLSSARLYARLQTREKEAMFVVLLMANESLSGVSHCFLRLSDSSIDLCDLDPQQTIASYPLTTIRRYTWTPLSFLLEIGRNGQTPAVGELHFETMAAKTIYDMLDKTLKEKKIQLDMTTFF